MIDHTFFRGLPSREFTGEIPKEIGNLRALEHLYVVKP
jgi:hypothetical protein